jgi:hypothetical protein
MSYTSCTEWGCQLVVWGHSERKRERFEWWLVSVGWGLVVWVEVWRDHFVMEKCTCFDIYLHLRVWEKKKITVNQIPLTNHYHRGDRMIFASCGHTASFGAEQVSFHGFSFFSPNLSCFSSISQSRHQTLRHLLHLSFPLVNSKLMENLVIKLINKGIWWGNRPFSIQSRRINK